MLPVVATCMDGNKKDGDIMTPWLVQQRLLWHIRLWLWWRRRWLTTRMDDDDDDDDDDTSSNCFTKLLLTTKKQHN